MTQIVPIKGIGFAKIVISIKVAVESYKCLPVGSEACISNSWKAIHGHTIFGIVTLCSNI